MGLLAAFAITLLVDAASGRVLATSNQAEAETRLVAPGSTVKPFTLLALEEQGKVADNPRIPCNGRLVLEGRRLSCAHPRMGIPLDSQAALAYSCNTWFAAMAPRLDRARFQALLRKYGFWVTGGDVRLMALGEAGITVTPLGLANAYRRLVSTTLFPGLRGAVEYGTAKLAKVDGLEVAGKTGTTPSPGRMSTHAWFAGYAPSDRPKVIVVVFAEEGKGGATAAPVAGELMRTWLLNSGHR